MHKLVRNLLWFLPLLAFAIGYYAMGFVFKSKTISAPALMGKPLDKAVSILSDHNLNIRIVGTKHDADLPEGTIISQTPTAGLKIKENQTMYVMIAKKPTTILAPDFKNKTISSAQQIAQELGITLKSYSLSSDISQDHCLAQLPLASQELENNNMIIYMSSAQHKSVIMPDLKDKPVTEVVSFLQLHGITPRIVHSIPIDPAHQCVHCAVIDQRPLAGSLVSLNAEKPLAVQLQVGQI